MSLPITKTHPTEVVFTMVTLHMIATPVFLNANVALRALKKKRNIEKINFSKYLIEVSMTLYHANKIPAFKYNAL